MKIYLVHPGGYPFHSEGKEVSQLIECQKEVYQPIECMRCAQIYREKIVP